jgi:hypothetical protein
MAEATKAGADVIRPHKRPSMAAMPDTSVIRMAMSGRSCGTRPAFPVARQWKKKRAQMTCKTGSDSDKYFASVSETGKI